MTEITNTADIIDSRDVITRIAELEDEMTYLEGDDFDPDKIGGPDDPVDAEIREEYQALIDLESACEDYSDWKYGATLISDHYFEDYARQLAEDIGCISGDEKWPLNCIDCEKATQELQWDYDEVNFNGEVYWIRNC